MDNQTCVEGRVCRMQALLVLSGVFLTQSFSVLSVLTGDTRLDNHRITGGMCKL
jgi:hypothetical protein